MKRIIVLSFKDGDVYEGLRRLIALNENAVVVLPVMGLPTFTATAMKAIEETKAKYHLFFTDNSEDIDKLILGAHDMTICANPIREVLREVTSEDVLAIVWDDSIEAHMALHAVEDYAIETWSIEDGLDFIEIDDDDENESDLLYQEMQEKLSEFIESFSEYVMHGVLEVITKAVQERIAEEEGTKEVNPFDEK
jgi:hypothetical protein